MNLFLSFLPFTIKDTIVWVMPNGLLATQRYAPWLWGRTSTMVMVEPSRLSLTLSAVQRNETSSPV